MNVRTSSKLISRLTRSVCVVLLVHVAGCVRLPQNPARPESWRFADTAGTRLGKAFSVASATQPSRSGLHPLVSGVDAFAARLTLANLAEKSLDVQYYIWDPDDTGRLLAGRLVAAADRDVRVRVLLDDFGSEAEDAALLALAGHPNIEVRLFNPMAFRANRILGMLLAFPRTNRRMHNKSFNADNQVAIVGGRNIGDGYFDSSSDSNMADLDVLAVGPVVEEVGKSFDAYWNSTGSFPIESLSGSTAPPPETEAGRARLQHHAQTMKESTTATAFAASPIGAQIDDGDVPFYWGNATLLYDDPRKAANDDDPKHRLLSRIGAIADRAQHELIVVSPYFVPGRAGVEYFRTLRQRGVRVLILTDSLASASVLPVYAAYSRYRKELLAMGVELYEFKPGATGHGDAGEENSASLASLHAKVFTFDRDSIFVGSLNLDPRSAHLNTEVGVVFDSREMTSDLSDRFQARLMSMAWRVEAVPFKGMFGDEVRFNWVTQERGATVRLTEEPGQSFWRNLSVGFLRVFAVESQL